MLRITLCEGSGHVDMKLEGNLTGIWVSELEHSWRAIDRTLAGRRLLVDLAEVSHVDKAGEYLLALLQGCGTELKVSGVAMTELVRDIAGAWPLTHKSNVLPTRSLTAGSPPIADGSGTDEEPPAKPLLSPRRPFLS